VILLKFSRDTHRNVPPASCPRPTVAVTVIITRRPDIAESREYQLRGNRCVIFRYLNIADRNADWNEIQSMRV
jgi:hypothetical protein